MKEASKTKAQLIKENIELRSQIAGYESSVTGKKSIVKKDSSFVNYESIFENLIDGFVLTDLSGSIIKYNRAFEKISGYGKEILGKLPLEFVVERDIERVNEEIGKVLITGYTSNFECTLLDKKKKEVFILINASLIHDEAGAPWGIAAIIRDINLRKRTEDALKESTEKFRSVFENSPLGISMTGVDGSLKVNKAFCEILGYSEEEIMLKKWQDITHPEDIGLSSDVVNSLINGEKANTTFQKRYLHKNGQIIWSEVNTTLLRDSRKKPMFFVTSISDITEKKFYERRILDEREFANQLIDSLPGLFYQIGPDGRFLKWNKNFEEVSGYSGSEIARISPLDFFEGEDKNLIGGSIQQVYEEGSAVAEAVFVSKNGNKTPFLFTGKQIRIDDSPFLVGMGLDVSAMKAAEGKLRESEEKYRTLIKSNPFPLGLVDSSGKLQYINDRFTRDFGYTLEDVPTLEEWWIKAYPDEEYRKWVLETWGKAVELARKEGTDIESIEYEVTCKTGDKRIIIIAGITLSDGFLATFIDVTDRKRAEDEKNRFFNLSLDLLCVAGTDGYFKRLNPAWTKILGYKEEVLLKKPFVDFVHPDDVGPTTEAVKQLSENRPVVNFINRYRHADGSYRWLLWASASHDGIIYAAAQDISDIKQAEISLKEAKEKLDLAIKGGGIGIWEWDLRTDVTIWDESMEKMFGLEAGTFGQDYDSFKKCLLPDDIHLVESAIKAALEEDIQYNVVYRVVWPNGEIKFIRAVATVTRDKSGKAMKMLGVCTDLTSIKRAEMELNSQKEMLQRIFDNIPVMITYFDEAGNIKMINHELTEKLGWSLDEWQAIDVFSKCYPDPEYHNEVMDFMLSNPDGWKDTLIETKYGTRLETTWTSVILPGGVLIGIGQDITERKKIENALVESEKRFKELVESLPQLFWTCRPDGPCDFISPQWVEYTGISEEKQLGYGWLDQLHPDDKVKVTAEWMEKIKSREFFDLEFRLRRYDNEYRWFRTRAIPFMDSRGEVVKWFGSNTDFDDVKKAEEKIRNAMLNLERSNQELEQFAYVASHDLQEPLRMVSSYTQLLSKRYKDKLDDDANDFINYAVDGANRMQRLINDLLEYSRVTTRGKPLVSVDLFDALGIAISGLHSKISETGAMITNDELPVCKGDELQMARVFQNLIDNAIKFKGDSEPRIHISSKKEEDHYIISVKDNGIGIEPQYQDRIFTIFQRLHNKTDYPGTGIGLAICKRTIERHGGKIWFESEPGNGTTFKFTLYK